jgi:hypothetical protein
MIAVFVTAYGVALQTGFSELLSYRGRSGWYLFLLSAVLVAIVLFEFESASVIRKNAFAVLPTLIALGSVASLVASPPNPDSYRNEYKEATFEGVQFASDLRGSGESLNVVSNVRLLLLLGAVDRVIPWEEVPDCPGPDDVAVVDFSPNVREFAAVWASIDGENLQSAQEVEQNRVLSLASEAVAVDGRLNVCGFVPVFSEDEVSVYLHR